jgi:outer membrane protein
MKIYGAAFLLLIGSGLADAQKPFSLKECINYSTTNNSKVKIANYDVEASEQRIREQRGIYLPQLNGSGSFDDNLRLATTLLPGELAGKPGEMVPITFGTKYNFSGGLQFTQKVYDMPSLIGIKSAKINNELSEQSLQKNTEQAAYNISVVYFQTLVIQKQINVLKATLNASEQSLKSIQLKFENGMARKIDVDKIRVSYNNTQSQLQQALLSYSQSMNTLKFQMGMPVDNALTLADSTISVSYEEFEKLENTNFQVDNLIDYRLQKTNLSLTQMEKKRSLAAFQPTLSFYSNMNVSAMRKEFNFFEAGQNWFPSYGVGLKLAVPIFDGLQRNARVAQSELNIQKAKENIKYTEQAIKVDLSNYEIRYKNALSNIKKEKENLDLAESVYKNTQLEYQQGTGTALDLVQAESSLMVAQNTYFNKLLDLYVARIEQEKAKGTLLEFINSQD